MEIGAAVGAGWVGGRSVGAAAGWAGAASGVGLALGAGAAVGVAASELTGRFVGCALQAVNKQTANKPVMRFLILFGAVQPPQIKSKHPLA